MALLHHGNLHSVCIGLSEDLIVFASTQHQLAWLCNLPGNHVIVFSPSSAVLLQAPELHAQLHAQMRAQQQEEEVQYGDSQYQILNAVCAK